MLRGWILMVGIILAANVCNADQPHERINGSIYCPPRASKDLSSHVNKGEEAFSEAQCRASIAQQHVRNASAANDDIGKAVQFYTKAGEEFKLASQSQFDGDDSFIPIEDQETERSKKYIVENNYTVPSSYHDALYLLSTVSYVAANQLSKIKFNDDSPVGNRDALRNLYHANSVAGEMYISIVNLLPPK